MKKVIISIIGVLLVSAALFFCFKYFRGEMNGNSPPSSDRPEADKVTWDANHKYDGPAQDGEADDTSQQFAGMLKSTTGMDYNPQNIVSDGKAIRTGACSYKVTSWSISKEYPGYALPEGHTPLSESPGATVDENGNITNDFSYVVVNMEVENMTPEAYIQYIWGTTRLESIGTGAGQYIGEVTYLGDNRPVSQDYFLETIEANGKKEMPLIFVVKDEYVEDNQLYIVVNPSGAADTNSDYDVKRYIFLT